MKLATYVLDSIPRIGIVHDDDRRVFDLAHAAALAELAPGFDNMLALIDSGPKGLENARRLVERYGQDESLSVELDRVRLLSPVPRPRQIRDAMTFPGHIRQAGAGMRRLASRLNGQTPSAADKPLAEVPDHHLNQPVVYFSNRMNVVGHDAVIRWPAYSSVIDFEVEFGIFIGRDGTNIAAGKARSHIFGYSVFNDFSARDTQIVEARGGMGPGKAKSFDGANAIGPWIVTADEIPNPYGLKMAARVNGETWTSGDSSDMLHHFEDIIAFITRDESIVAGEFIGSGTMSSGCGLELDRYLNDGDVIEIDVEQIGILRNRIDARNKSNRSDCPNASIDRFLSPA
jgi:2-keto-4-pentenoate hydratase/2-oxohepta-3-ene-1,7-dioic acid hydratase in catechol pathway